MPSFGEMTVFTSLFFLKYTASMCWTFGIPSGSSLLNFSCNPRSVGLRVMDTFWPLSFVPC